MLHTLILPNNYTHIESNELEYVDGGVFVSNNQLSAICFAGGASGLSAAAITASVDGIAATIATTIPGLGWVTGGVLVLYGAKFGVAAAQALAQGKGLEISLGYPWGINFSPSNG